tara:strand:+ start:961 stop:1578 length:618 start_codon:yes stop_codon:yes gene_type:complete
MTLAIIETGCANIVSVQAALDRLGARQTLVRDPDEARDAARLILPGVGSAGAAMGVLTARGWADALHQEERPLLGICLGMQVLFEQSGEGDVACLGLLPGKVEKLSRPDGGVWPHMGWNQLDFEPGREPLLAGIDPGAYVYFVHGYAAPVCGSTVATCDYGQAFSAMVRRGAVMGCQFHPERSSNIGSRILHNFMSMSDETLSSN